LYGILENHVVTLLVMSDFPECQTNQRLEADAIIIADLNGSTWAMNAQSLYVASSRAKHLLALCVHKDVKWNI